MSNATVLTDRFDRALLYATHVHGGQVRKGTSTPYVAHLLAVAATVLEYGGDEELAIAALLHDSAEDQGGKARLEDVRNRFSERVARIVEACSDSLADTGKGERKADWHERKKAYLKHLQTADDGILLVSLADKVHNARAILRDRKKPEIGEAIWSRFSQSRKDTLWYYRSLAETFCQRLPGQLSNELSDIVAVLEAGGSPSERIIAVREMGSRLLRAIEDRDESLAAFHLTKECVQKDAVVFPDHLMGWQGGGGRRTAYWLSKLGFWAVLEQSPPDSKKRRFWNCFGTANPAEQQMLTITVEINPPHEGDNRRVAGLFARDEENRIYIAHTGRVGGGRTGIGQNAFREFLGRHRWHEIETPSGIRTAVLLGPIDSRDFTNQLADFVHKVADFKAQAIKISAAG